MSHQPQPSKTLNFIAVLLGASILGVWLFAVFSPHQPAAIWHYRMTVAVQTPEGVKTGSTVREVVYNGVGRGGGISTVQLKYRGEAVVVDLGKRGLLFALADGGDDLLLRAFAPASVGGLSPNSVPKEGKTVVSPMNINFPWFAKFQDLNDPKTIEHISSVIGDTRRDAFPQDKRFEDAFGAGVFLKEITIEMTNEPVTNHLLSILPWLPEYRNKMFDGARYNSLGSQYPFANSLSAGAFIVGIPY